MHVPIDVKGQYNGRHPTRKRYSSNIIDNSRQGKGPGREADTSKEMPERMGGAMEQKQRGAGAAELLLLESHADSQKFETPDLRNVLFVTRRQNCFKQPNLYNECTLICGLTCFSVFDL